jgi:outer membrane receptor protein involved in Fe transport
LSAFDHPVKKLAILLALLVGLTGTAAYAAFGTIYGAVQGVVHDAQHRPISGAKVTLHAAHTDLVFNVVANQDGVFRVPSVPLGEYVLTVGGPGFENYKQPVTVNSETTVSLHLQLNVAAVQQTVTVEGYADAANVDATTTQTLISREDIADTPGADKTNSLAMITDFVPGAYMTHDMLHMRGGHELNWLIDGVSLPNTNIASNVAPQIDPKDIESLEVDRGSYNASLGDRTYGMFNVVPRSGFDGIRDGELVLTAGSFFQTNDQVRLASHSDKFAWYTSLNGNRSDYGLAPAVSQPVHDADNGYGGFGSVIWNRTPADQIRINGQLRTDYYQIPVDPDPNDWESQFYPSYGLSDGEHETDSYLIASWLHTFSANTVSQVSPFFHFNKANLQSNPNDQPAATNAAETGNYAGLQATISTVWKRNSITAGVYGYAQHENDGFSAVFNDGSLPAIMNTPNVTLAGVEELYVEDNFKATDWLTLNAGERQTHFVGDRTEGAVYPRVGAAIQIPKLNWVFRGFYGHFYQPPPVTKLSGTQVQILGQLNESFVTLKGERNEEHQFGVQIPFKGWLLDADTFENRGRNFLDHNNIGESSIFIPITVQGSLIQAWELTLRSPHLWHFGQAHLSYSNQLAEQIGGINSGLVCVGAAVLPTDPCYVAPGYSALDHDQRNTLNLGFNGHLPYRITGSFNVYYGSGFSNGDQDPPSPYSGAYLPSHTTADLSLGKQFGENYTVSATATNVGNTRALLDNSLTFGGFHYNDPRQIYAELRYRFHF